MRELRRQVLTEALARLDAEQITIDLYRTQ